MARSAAGKWHKRPFRIRWTGTAWQADLFVNGQRMKKSFRGLCPKDPEAYRQAQQWAVSTKADEFRGLIKAERSSSEIPFKGLAAMFLEDLALASSNTQGTVGRSIWTYRYYRHRLGRYICPELGDISAQRLTRADVLNYLQSVRRQRYGQDEVNKHVQVIKRVYNWAIERELVQVNPTIGIKKDAAPRTVEPRFYTRQEQDAILAKLSGQAYGFILTAFRAGLRRRELMAFDFSWILWDRSLVLVPFSRRFRAKSRRERHIPLAPDLKAWLRSLGRDIGPVFTTRRRYVVAGGDRRFRPLRDSRRMMREVHELLGFPIRLHDARHSFASTLMQEGVDMRYVQAVLGHASITTTEIYSHLANDYLEQVRTAMVRAHGGGKCPGSVPTMVALEGGPNRA